MINRRLQNIVVPVDKESMRFVYDPDTELEQYVDKFIVLPLEQGIYDRLFDALFNSLNMELDLFIDYGEEEEITDNHMLYLGREIVDKTMGEFSKIDLIISFYLEKIKQLFELAIKYNTGVFFLL